MKLAPGPTHSHGTPISWLAILKGTPSMQPIGKQGMLFPWLALQQERDTKDMAQCKVHDTLSLWPIDRNRTPTPQPNSKHGTLVQRPFY